MDNPELQRALARWGIGPERQLNSCSYAGTVEPYAAIGVIHAGRSHPLAPHNPYRMVLQAAP